MLGYAEVQLIFAQTLPRGWVRLDSLKCSFTSSLGSRVMLSAGIATLSRSVCRPQVRPVIRTQLAIGRLPTAIANCECGARTLAVPPTEAKPFSEVPGPLRLPFVGSALSFLFSGQMNQPIYERQKEWVEKYGPISRLKVPTIPEMVMICEPRDVEVMFRAEGKNPRRLKFQAWNLAREELKIKETVFFS